MAKSGSSTRVLSEGLTADCGKPQPAALQKASAGEHLDVPGLVGGLDGQELHDLLEMWVQLRDETAWDHQRSGLVLDQVGHKLDDGVLDLIGKVEGLVPRYDCVGIPLGGDRGCVEADGFVSPNIVLLGQLEVEIGCPVFNGRPPCSKSPSLRGCVNHSPWLQGVAATGERSMPIHSRPRDSALTHAVAQPQNGSRTTSPGFELASTMRSSSLIGFWVG